MAKKSRLKFGTNGDDTLNGTDDGEVFFGFGGNDTIFGRGGKDVAFGGRGDDLIFGGKGKIISSASAATMRWSERGTRMTSSAAAAEIYCSAARTRT
jgi:hypothetical protein